MGFKVRERKGTYRYLAFGLLALLISTSLTVPAFAGQFAELSRESKQSQHLVWVKYRPTPVDVADPRFDYLDTSKSSFVTGAWYDESNSYMVIGLKGTYYHYCRMPRNAWDSFRSADSFGRHFNRFIKGRFDCRQGGVPEY